MTRGQVSQNIFSTTSEYQLQGIVPILIRAIAFHHSKLERYYAKGRLLNTEDDVIFRTSACHTSISSSLIMDLMC